ncbi:MAG: LysR family transcriptional regulator [Gammaproteobacteria bacterium]|nr:LysR family transcriptional regulator [Gammaproteobacteria bacterium]NNM00622.1 LysR family transcriptional regulator [Gammaproteobacteria bacterium]
MNLDLELLRTYVTVVSLGGFTRAAEQLNKTQSTVSAQVKKLETLLDQQLMERDTRNLRLTAQGELLLERARHLLRLNDDLISELSEPDLEGRVRLGTPEDFATSHLPQVLAAFRRAHPRVRLEVTCDLTRNLARQFDAGEHDLVLLKREPLGPSMGIQVWREPLVWVMSPEESLANDDEVSLVLSPEPCIYRERAVAALNEISRPWRIAYQSTSLAGTLAAVRAGLGVTLLPKDMVPHGYHVVGEAESMPLLPDTEIALCARKTTSQSQPVRKLYEHIVHALEST